MNYFENLSSSCRWASSPSHHLCKRCLRGRWPSPLAQVPGLEVTRVWLRPGVRVPWGCKKAHVPTPMEACRHPLPRAQGSKAGTVLPGDLPVPKGSVTGPSDQQRQSRGHMRNKWDTWSLRGSLLPTRGCLGPPLSELLSVVSGDQREFCVV